MKELMLLIITLLSVNTSASEQSLYTYDCENEEKESDFPTYFHLRQEFKGGIVVDGTLNLELTEVIHAQRNFENTYVYEGQDANFVLSWGLASGTGFGSAFIVKDSKKAKYFCSLDWSPY